MSQKFMISRVRHISSWLSTAIFINLVVLGGRHRTQTVGKWTRNASFLVPQPNIYERRKDLSGVTLKNSILPWEPVMIIKDQGNDKLILDGFMFSIFNVLQGVSVEKLLY